MSLSSVARATTRGKRAVALSAIVESRWSRFKVFSPNTTSDGTFLDPDMSLYQPLFSRKGDDTGKRNCDPYLPLWKTDDPASRVFIPTDIQRYMSWPFSSPDMSRERWHTQHVQFCTNLISLTATSLDVRHNRVKRPDWPFHVSSKKDAALDSVEI